MATTKYQKSDFRPLSWEEYGGILETLYQKIKEYVDTNNLKIDAVIPILRGGNIPGTFLAYRFHQLNILPVQFKYLNTDGKYQIHNLTKLPKEAFQTRENPTFLVVENNHCFGTTAKAAVAFVKEAVPGAKILYSATFMDYSNQEMPGAEAIFYGKLSNETRGLSEEEAREKGIPNTLSLFPWESVEEEWAMVNEEEFNYE